MVPEGWSRRKLAEILYRIVDPVEVDPTDIYQEIGIRSHGKGIFHKEPVQGEKLGNKRVFWVKSDCLIVNIVFAWEQAVARTTKEEVGKIASHRFPMYRPKDNAADVDFLTYYFKTPHGKRLLGLASPGGAGRNKTLGQKEFGNIGLLLPTGIEQQKIARILSTWDKAIATVEKLIENSKAQKKALMQQLLTGKRRLPGFSEEWQKTAIKQMGQVLSGGTPDTQMPDYWSGDVLWTTPTDITAQRTRYISDTARKITRKGVQASSARLLPSGALLVCTRATIGYLAITEREITTNQGFKSLIPNPDFDSDFLYYLFSYHKHQFVRFACGSTFLELSKKDFEKQTFLVPPLKEQEKIADILAKNDRELFNLEETHARFITEKTALMQQLLTGKRRVNTTDFCRPDQGGRK